LAAWLLGALAVSAVASAQTASVSYRLIVNPRNPAASVERRFLAEAFLKKTSSWPSGETIRPVDLAADSPARRRFTDEVLNRSVPAVKSYWQQLIFAGRDVPPPELDSDEAVIRYVQRYPGAIGYVSGAVAPAALAAVKVLAVVK
jgi:ABC-type phosphate transport system substrate-binding protein